MRHMAIVNEWMKCARLMSVNVVVQQISKNFLTCSDGEGEKSSCVQVQCNNQSICTAPLLIVQFKKCASHLLRFANMSKVTELQWQQDCWNGCLCAKLNSHSFLVTWTLTTQLTQSRDSAIAQLLQIYSEVHY